MSVIGKHCSYIGTGFWKTADTFVKTPTGCRVHSLLNAYTI